LVRKGYRNLSVPNQLYEELERFADESKGRYVSVAEVVKEAVKGFLGKKHLRREFERNACAMS